LLVLAPCISRLAACNQLKLKTILFALGFIQHFIAQSLFVFQLEQSITFFFGIFLPLLFVDLFLEGFRHRSALLFSFDHHDFFFISALED